ncbi:hypothetical protein ACX6XY_13190 [Streptomyces sp. O3]
MKHAALAASALAMVAVSAAPAVSAETPDVPADVEISALKVPVSGLASQETKKTVEANPQRAQLSGVVCGSSYPKLVRAERLPEPNTRKATLYIWQGSKTGSGYYDKAICSTLWNDTGKAHYLRLKLCSNYTADPCDEDKGTFSSYAGPVYQKRGYCGQTLSQMKIGGKLVVNRYNRVGFCN